MAKHSYDSYKDPFESYANALKKDEYTMELLKLSANGNLTTV